MGNKLRVWWIPQVPGTPFYVPISSVEDGCRIMKVLAEYDKFQYDQNVKPDYCNVGGIQEFDPTDIEDGPLGSWCDWFDEDTGIDDPEQWLKLQENTDE